MSRDRSELMGQRPGLRGWFDRIRYREIYRQGFGLLLVLVCAMFAGPGEERILFGLFLALCGQVFRIYAAGTIFKNRQLATSGAYGLVRHPLYLGNILILGGFTLASGNIVVAVIVLAFFLVWYPAAVRYEDAKLERIFGEDWRRWSRGIGAVFPRRLTFRGLRGQAWSAHQSLIRNGELPISLYLAGCAAWLWYRAAG